MRATVSPSIGRLFCWRRLLAGRVSLSACGDRGEHARERGKALVGLGVQDLVRDGERERRHAAHRDRERPGGLLVGGPLTAVGADEYLARVSPTSLRPRSSRWALSGPSASRRRTPHSFLKSSFFPVGQATSSRLSAELAGDERDALGGEVLQAGVIGDGHTARSSHQPATAINGLSAWSRLGAGVKAWPGGSTGTGDMSAWPTPASASPPGARNQRAVLRDHRAAAACRYLARVWMFCLSAVHSPGLLLSSERLSGAFPLALVVRCHR